MLALASPISKYESPSPTLFFPFPFDLLIIWGVTRLVIVEWVPVVTALSGRLWLRVKGLLFVDGEAMGMISGGG